MAARGEPRHLPCGELARIRRHVTGTEPLSADDAMALVAHIDATHADIVALTVAAAQAEALRAEVDRLNAALSVARAKRKAEQTKGDGTRGLV